VSVQGVPENPALLWSIFLIFGVGTFYKNMATMPIYLRIRKLSIFLHLSNARWEYNANIQTHKKWWNYNIAINELMSRQFFIIRPFNILFSIILTEIPRSFTFSALNFFSAINIDTFDTKWCSLWRYKLVYIFT